MIKDLYNIKVNVERPAITQDDYGAQIQTWATQITSMPCRMQAKRSSERLYGGATAVMSDYMLYCGANNSIQAKDRILYSSDYYLVVGLDVSYNFTGKFQKLDLLKVTE